MAHHLYRTAPAAMACMALLMACAGTATPPAGADMPGPTATPVSENLQATPSPPISPMPTPQPTRTAANADVEHVRAVQSADGSWTFYVTVRHPDIGWDDYADGWDVVTPTGEVLKPDPDSQFTRTLLHPHQDEQPFTRSQGGIVIPEGVSQVQVRAHDLVDGFGGQVVQVDLAQDSGPGFEVQRGE
jgi:hypothetical protein